MTIRVLQGDCRSILATLPDASVQCVVTSPPYFGLRDYGTAQWDGGDPACDHRKTEIRHRRNLAAAANACDGGYRKPEDRLDKDALWIPFRDTCGKCGARRIDAQIGLEASPSDYIAEMVAVFREVRRVLRDDGTLWLNLGDSYNNFRVSKGPGQALHGRDNLHGKPTPDSGGRGWVGAKEKDLLMMPARVALALQQDGWWLRSQLPWIKRSCMPESCNDRPTSAIEYVYLLTKSPRYFWDAAAVAREGAQVDRKRADKFGGKSHKERQQHSEGSEFNGSATRNFRNSDLFFDSLNAPYGLICDADGNPLALDVNPAAYAESHFATFPAALVAPLVKASTSERGCCANCGAPWVRVVEQDKYERKLSGPDYNEIAATRRTTGWLASCQCQAAVVPATVLDPFAGAFTAPMVADRLQRNAIGIELSEAYCEMARARLLQDAGMFAEVA